MKSKDTKGDRSSTAAKGVTVQRIGPLVGNEKRWQKLFGEHGRLKYVRGI